MTPESAHSSDRERRLDEIVTSYLKAMEAGKEPEEKLWLERYPELAEELNAFFAAQKQVEAMAGGGSPVAETIGLEGTNSTADSKRVRYFGDYELLEEIARGGMGVVYKAKQVSLNRVVALKMILKGEFASEADVRRFRQEAEAAANLDHPNIVPIYEVGEHEGQQYFSMKLISVVASDEWRVASNEGQRRVASTLAKVARAVHHAHQRGILHRDLKPGNILIDANGEPHVADFGLAKKVDGGGEATRSGAIVGTPAFMAPEQARAEKSLTTAVDVWSLGVILYEGLTERLPFLGENAMATLLRIANEEPPKPRSLNAMVDRDLETICLKCLEKDPTRRYPSAAALADDLEHWLRAEPITARPIGRGERVWRWARRNPVLAAMAALILVGVAVLSLGSWWAAWHFNRLAVREQEARKDADAANSQSQQRLARQYLVQGLTPMKEGRYLEAFPWFAQALDLEKDADRQHTQQVRLGGLWRQMPRLTQVLFHEGSVSSAAFSPDSQRVCVLWYMFAGPADKEPRHRVRGQVRDVETGESVGPFFERDMKDGHYMTSPVLHSDGSTVATTGEGGRALIWDATTGKLLREITVDPQQNVLQVQFTPDGDGLLVQSGAMTIVGRDLEAPILRKLTFHDWRTGKERHPPIAIPGGSVHYAEYSADGRFLLTLQGLDQPGRIDDPAKPGACLWDAKTGKLIGEPFKYPVSLLQASINRDATCAVFVSGDRMVHFWNPQTWKQASSAVLNDREVVHAEVHPTRPLAVLTDGNGGVRVWDYHQDAAYGTLTDGHFTPIVKARFSRDGRSILYQDSKSTVRQVELGNPEWQQRIPLTHPGGIQGALVSPDSRFIGLHGDHRLLLWDGASAPEEDIQFPAERIKALAVAPDGAKALVWTRFTKRDDPGPQLGKVRIWDTRTREPVSDYLEVGGLVDFSRTAEFSKNGQTIHLSFSQIWQEGKFLPGGTWLFDAAGKRIGSSAERGMVLAPDGSYGVFSKREEKEGQPATSHPVIWRARDNLSIDLAEKGTSGSVQFSADSKRFCDVVFPANEVDKTWKVHVWDAATGKLEFSQSFPGRWIRLSDDGKHLMVHAGKNMGGEISGWEVATGRPLGPAIAVDANILERCLCFHPDGRRVLLTSLSHPTRSQTLRVWDLTTGKPTTAPMLELNEWGRAFPGLAFSPEGRFLGSVSSLNGWAVYDAATGDPLFPVERTQDNITSIFTFWEGEHRLVLVGDRRQSVELTPLDYSISEWEVLARLHSGKQVDDLGSLVEMTPEDYQATWEKVKSLRGGHFVRRTADELHVWREFQARQCLRDNNSDGMLLHLRPLLEKPKVSWQVRHLEAQAFVLQQRWDIALTKLSALVSEKEDEFDLYYQQAFVALKANRRDIYETACRRMLAIWGGRADPIRSARLAWLCTITPNVVGDKALIETLADRAEAGEIRTLAQLRLGTFPREDLEIGNLANTPNLNMLRGLGFLKAGNPKAAQSLMNAHKIGVEWSLLHERWEERLSWSILLEEIVSGLEESGSKK